MTRSYPQGVILLIAMIVLGVASLLGFTFFSSFGASGFVLAYHAAGTFIGGAILLGIATYFALRSKPQEYPGSGPRRWRVKIWCRHAGIYIIAMIFVSVLVNIMTIQTTSTFLTFIVVLQIISAALTWLGGFLSSQFPQIPQPQS